MNMLSQSDNSNTVCYRTTNSSGQNKIVCILDDVGYDDSLIPTNSSYTYPPLLTSSINPTSNTNLLATRQQGTITTASSL